MSPPDGALSGAAFASLPPLLSALGSAAAGELDAVPESEPEPPSDDAAAALDAEREAELRSFFAQPVPLKWNVGAENALRTGAAPQMGQVAGPSAVTEWMTSKRCSFGQR